MGMGLGRRERSDIVVNLSFDSSHDVRRESAYSVQREAHDRCNELLRKYIQAARQHRDYLKHHPRGTRRYHHTIMINGSRGTGKTTFLANCLPILADALGRAGFDGGRQTPIVDLGFIDPTLLSTHENVMMILLSRIMKAVEDVRNNGTLNEATYAGWRDALRGLSTGLAQLDVGDRPTPEPDGWHDPDFLLEKGLRDAVHGKEFEHDFHRFVDLSLVVLGRDAFLVRIDDVDTLFDRGWHVLEVIRRYLTTPQLLIVLAGDIELYAQLVRREQFKGFDGNYQELATLGGASAINHMINQLEEQYLMKLFRPENRIELHSLYYLSCHQSDIRIEMEGKGEVPLNIVLDTMCRELWGLQNDWALTRYAKLLLKQPIRTFSQALIEYARITKPCDPESLQQEKTAPFSGEAQVASWRQRWTIREGQDDAARDADVHSFCLHFASIFVTTLRNSKIQIKELEHLDKIDAVNLLVAKLHENDMLTGSSDLYRLKPATMDDGQNILLATLGAIYAHHFAGEPAMIMEYMLKVGLTVEVARVIAAEHGKDARDGIGYDLRSDKRAEIRGEMDRFLDYAHLTSRSYTIDTTRLYGSYRESYPKSGIQRAGILIARASTKQNRQTYANKLKQLDGTQKLLFSSIFAQTMLAGGRPVHASIFNLLGFLTGTLTVQDSGLKSFILSHAHIRANFCCHEIYRGLEKLTEREDVAPYGDEDLGWALGSEDTCLITSLRAWRNMGRGIPVRAISFYGRIWSRFVANLVAIDSRYRPHAGGDVLHRWIVAFLNSILAEELVLAGLDAIPLNAVTSDVQFDENLRRRKEGNDVGKAYPVFDFFYACPLWCVFANFGEGTGTYMDHLARNLGSPRRRSTSAKWLQDLHRLNINGHLNDVEFG